MMKKIISLALTIILVCTILTPATAASINQTNYYTITASYTYPVLPGTDEWQTLSMDERIALSHVDEDIVENMTTEAVLLTAINYPFIVNIFAYDTEQEGIDIVKGYCSSLAELLTRDDALHALTSYLHTATNTESVAYYVAEKLWTYINATTTALPRYVVDPITGERVAQVTTPNGSVVLVIEGRTWESSGTTYAKAKMNNDWAKLVYGAISLRDIDPSYNCHSYAWHSTSTSNHYWMEDPDKYIDDGSYVAGTGAVGNKITYIDQDGVNIHSGIVTSSGTITSKWGILGLFQHTVEQCPYYVDSVGRYYWQRAS